MINISRAWLKLSATVAGALVGLSVLPQLSPALSALALAIIGLGVAAGTLATLSPILQRSFQTTYLHYTILPVSVAVASGAWLRSTAPPEVILPAILGAGLILAVAIFCQIRRAQGREGPKHPEELFSNLISYLTAFVLFVAIRHLGQPPLLDAVIIGAVSSVLAFDIFWWAKTEVNRALLYSGLMGLFLAETAWGLNFWTLGGISMGLLLFLFYYSATGIAHNHLIGKLTSVMALEFAAVSVTGTVLLYGLQTLA